MIYPIDRNIHRPLHLYLDDAIYFITARTIHGNKFFNNDIKKDLLYKRIESVNQKYNLKLYAWVIVDNHYHLLFNLVKGDDLASLMQEINGGSSYDLNRLEEKKNRKIWYNYWDYCIRNNDKDFWNHFNYIHNNPIKHGLVNNFTNLHEYRFSSYSSYLDKYGLEWLMSCFTDYPIIDFSINKD